MPFLDAFPSPEKYESGTEIANAQGQEITRKISPRYSAVSKFLLTAQTIAPTTIERTTTAIV